MPVEETVIAAPPEEVFEWLADVEAWTHVHPPAVHAEYLERGEGHDVVRTWTRVGGGLRAELVRRELDRARGRIAFGRGVWTLRPGPHDSTLVRLSHDGCGDALLDTLIRVAGHSELADLTVTAAGSRVVPGVVEGVFRRFERFGRVCLPYRLVAGKRTCSGGLVAVLTGRWEFAAAPGGVLVSHRHRATIDPAAVPSLGTVLDARARVTRILRAEEANRCLAHTLA